ncbi:type IV-A pilus assembly ATPase PilB [Thalassotalea nanhaiensis]|uniref:Type IV-A pilus assembly ATPase PilB n=1 Tax=Thalassotalea nanhaiensis TaxID=3065648 RepID=A0ABY9TJW9_9GAMM|nr:type IV-A pilus assembly ATPase PilB [Colwelliaceae bacterium SQ345]
MKDLHRKTSLLSALVRNDLIEKEHIAEVFGNSQKQKMSIVDYLVTQKSVNSYALAKVLSKSFGCPFFDLQHYSCDAILTGIRDEKLLLKHDALPLFSRGNVLYVAVSDPTNFDALEEIQFNTGLTTEMVLTDSIQLKQIINKIVEGEVNNLGISEIDLDELSDIDVAEEKVDEQPSNSTDSDAPIVIFVNKILLEAIKKGASDLHFEPYEDEFRIRFRVDGVLIEITNPPAHLSQQIISRLKVMSKLDIAERRMPQDGRIKLKLSKKHSIDFRVSTLPTMWGEKVVMRILDSSSAKLGIEVLGYEAQQQELFLNALNQSQGMILVTGPTGSGKTVSLYTGLNILNTVGRNISTAEDPVEINLKGVNQVQINLKAGLDFSIALKAFLRQDPDVIMVGEIRDLETAEISVKAAQTGHLVLSTLHTNSAAETLTRLLNMGVAAYNIASSVNLIIAQRLARRLCEHCKIEDPLGKTSLRTLGYNEERLSSVTVFGPKGCEHCNEGYKGRVGVYEVMNISKSLAKIINNEGTSLDIEKQAIQEGFKTLRQSGLMKVLQGVTSLQEINRVTSSH